MDSDRNAEWRSDLAQLVPLSASRQKKTLINWLLGDNERLRESALQILRRMGRPAVDMLLHEVRGRGHRLWRRLRGIDALEKLEGPFEYRPSGLVHRPAGPEREIRTGFLYEF